MGLCKNREYPKMISTMAVLVDSDDQPWDFGGIRTLPLSMAVAAVAVAAGTFLLASVAAAVEASPQSGWLVSSWNHPKKWAKMKIMSDHMWSWVAYGRFVQQNHHLFGHLHKYLTWLYPMWGLNMQSSRYHQLLSYLAIYRFWTNLPKAFQVGLKYGPKMMPLTTKAMVP